MFEDVITAVWSVEHNNNPYKLLHKNAKEKTYTFFGIYPYTKLPSHFCITKALSLVQGDVKKASYMLSTNAKLHEEVLHWYRINFYEKLNLQYLESVKKAQELMVFFVNVGTSPRRQKKAVMFIQSIIGAKVDGIAGAETLYKINSYPDNKFDKLFDKFEIKFYRGLVKKHPRLKWALDGWIRRANLV